MESSSPTFEGDVYSPCQLIEKGNPARMVLVLKRELEEVVFVPYEKEGRTLFGIDAVNSPVMTFSSSVLRGTNKLGQASISAAAAAGVVPAAGSFGSSTNAAGTEAPSVGARPFKS